MRCRGGTAPTGRRVWGFAVAVSRGKVDTGVCGVSGRRGAAPGDRTAPVLGPLPPGVGAWILARGAEDEAEEGGVSASGFVDGGGEERCERSDGERVEGWIGFCHAGDEPEER